MDDDRGRIQRRKSLEQNIHYFASICQIPAFFFAKFLERHAFYPIRGKAGHMPVSGKKAIFAQLLARKDLYVGNAIRNYVGQNNIYYQNTRFMRSYHNIQLIELHYLYKIMTCHKKVFWCGNDSLLAIFKPDQYNNTVTPGATCPEGKEREPHEGSVKGTDAV